MVSPLTLPHGSPTVQPGIVSGSRTGNVDVVVGGTVVVVVVGTGSVGWTFPSPLGGFVVVTPATTVGSSRSPPGIKNQKSRNPERSADSDNDDYRPRPFVHRAGPHSGSAVSTGRP